MKKDTKEFYSPEEIAERLGVNKMTIYRLLTKGELPYHQIGKLKRIHRDDFQAFLDTTRRQVKNDDG